MSKRVIIILILALCISFTLTAQNRYAEEKEILEDMISSMVDFMDTLDNYKNDENVDKIIDAVVTLVEDFKDLVPKVEEIEDANPDWGDNPPSEMKATMERFMEVGPRFAESMNSLTTIIEENADNDELMDALMQLGEIMN
jgi:TRAP-type C4-dicarboxylate transport system substrate-binding protein